MTDRFVGPGGSDGNDGLTWANRKLTLDGVEDTPVVAGDDIYVGPGVYREDLNVDVSGSGGSPITYIGDVTGENTDGIGGIVRITASDDDLTADRFRTIDADTKDFRTFRGFHMDFTLNVLIEANNCDDWVIEDCTFAEETTGSAILVDQGGINWTIRRCYFLFTRFRGIWFTNGTILDDVGHLVENCVFVNCQNPIFIEREGDGTIKNCHFSGASSIAVNIPISQNASHPWNVNNCLFHRNSVVLSAATSGDIVEDFNNFFSNITDRTNVATGADSQTHNPLLLPPILFDGIKMPSGGYDGALSEFSPVARIAGTSEATDDLFGIARPTTSAKKSWGAIQLREGEREASTVRTGSAAITLADAGDHQIFIPTDGTEITVDVFGRFETDYAGTKPQLIIRQPGAADSTDTMTGGADAWEQLSITITPDASPDYVVAIIRSLNTATSGSFAAFFDDLQVT